MKPHVLAQGQVRSSTILVATKSSTRIYRDVRDVPPATLQKLRRSTEGPYSAQIVIADAEGRKRIREFLDGLTQAQSPVPPPPAPTSSWRAIVQWSLIGAASLSAWAYLAFR